jgi:hypothetical protein
MENSNHLSAIRRCTGCGRFENEPLGVNENGEPYLACCPDSRYRNITAVQWLESEMLKPNLSMRDILEQAKEMEKAEKIKFATDFFFWWYNQTSGTNTYEAVEKFYKETYGGNK